MEKKKPELDLYLNFLPHKLAHIIKQVNKEPATDAAKRFGLDHALSVIGKDKLPPDLGAKLPNAIPDAAGKPRPVPDLGERNEIRHVGEKGAVRDWNPDSRWAKERGYSIRYSSSRNAVLCPELNISSDRDSLTHRAGAERMVLPARVYVPENPVQPVPPGSNGDGSVPRNMGESNRSEKKDDSGK